MTVKHAMNSRSLSACGQTRAAHQFRCVINTTQSTQSQTDLTLNENNARKHNKFRLEFLNVSGWREWSMEEPANKHNRHRSESIPFAISINKLNDLYIYMRGLSYTLIANPWFGQVHSQCHFNSYARLHQHQVQSKTNSSTSFKSSARRLHTSNVCSWIY